MTIPIINDHILMSKTYRFTQIVSQLYLIWATNCPELHLKLSLYVHDDGTAWMHSIRRRNIFFATAHHVPHTYGRMVCKYLVMAVTIL